MYKNKKVILFAFASNDLSNSIYRLNKQAKDTSYYDEIKIHSDYYNNQLDTSADNSPYYELSDVLLTFEAQCPNEAGQKAMIANKNGAWEYNAYSSYYNVVQSADHNAILNINTSRTIGTIINSVPSLWLNNGRYNSQLATQFRKVNATGILKRGVEMKNFTYTKGGLRIP